MRVLLVEDVDDLRAVLRLALQRHGGFDVVGDVGDGKSALRAAADLRPDVVVLDLGLPDLAGADLVTRVRAATPESRVVVYTGNVAPDSAELDVDAFVNKDKGVRYLVELLANIGRDGGERSVSRRFGPARGDVVEARRLVQDRCADWGCGSVTQSAVLVTSELVTNALIHGGNWCDLRVSFADQVLRIEVHDASAESPDLVAAEDDAEGGRGLLIVSSLSEAWGVETRVDGKVVWAELVSPELIVRAG